jgi:hypothetical protein
MRETHYGKPAHCQRPGCGRIFHYASQSPHGKGRATQKAQIALASHEEAHARRDADGRSHDDLKPPRFARRKRPEPPLWV